MTALVRLYPAAYRQEFGDEIADAYHEATRAAGWPARVREGVDVVGHALRMRLGLGSAGRSGRLLAASAPFAAIAIGATALGWARLMGHAVLTDDSLVFPLLAATQLVAMLGAFLALAGRWGVGSWIALAGIVAEIAVGTVRTGAGLIWFGAFFSAPLLALTLVTVLCPPDLRPAPRIRTRTGVVAVMAWTVVVAGALVVVPLPGPLSGLRFAVPVAGGLLLAGRQAFVRLRTAPAVLLAGLPFLYFGVVPGGLAVSWLAGLLGLLLVAAVVVSVRRRRGGRDPLAGG
ncbi:hypothetical protein [Streptomyces sp. NBC_01443]|uniref:hypothetical protein n=1 Tax=Streptomyces sp. NBC_01443 TaxID=2903868 RepID=UPI0022557556|nr:hypothetical protein [Streptomyces sp. NBC_01443]MCX4625880.1 hypothetical protein [Streptomyces sp. NBC_01443]